MLAPTKAAVLAEAKKKAGSGASLDHFLLRKSGQKFFNASEMDLKRILGAPDDVAENLRAYVDGFSDSVRDVFERFDFHTQISRLHKSKLLFMVTERFANVDLKMRKSLGSKRKELSEAHIEELSKVFESFRELTKDGAPISRIFKNEDFGYRTITVERPERDAKGKVVLGTKGKGKGKPAADSKLRDTENVPLSEDVQAYFEREVLPHAPDAWIDEEKTKVGYEIPFNRHFYVFKPPRPLSKIDAELKGVTDRIVKMIGALSQ